MELEEAERRHGESEASAREDISRRAVGWLLLLGWPGVMTGISLTAIAMVPAIGHPLSLVNWGVAAIGCGVGGYLAPTEAGARPGAAFCGILLGAGVYYVAIVTADNITATL